MTAPIIKAAARALLNAYYPMSQNTAELIVGIILPVVTPLIRAAALEEAAKIFDEDSYHLFDGQGIAAAILALKEQP